MSRGELLGRDKGEGLEALDRSSLSNRAYQQIRHALKVGEFKPGQKLNGREIAALLGTSLTPVREALLQLVAEGALDSRAGHAITVPVPSRRAFIEISHIRAELEGLAAEQAAALIDERGIEELSVLQQALQDAKRRQDFAAALRTNEAFHFRLCRAAEMPRLLRLVENAWTQGGPFLNYLYSGPYGLPVGGEPNWHDLVLEALRARDGASARRFISDDILRGGADMKHRLPE